MAEACLIEGCLSDATPGKGGAARGYCQKHYKERRDPCTVAACGKPQVGRGWCSKHWSAWKRYGDPFYRRPGEVRDGRRLCSRCKRDLPVVDLERGCGWCKPCIAENMRNRRRANPEEVRAARERYYWKDPDAGRQRSRDWRKRNPEKVLDQAKKEHARRRGARSLVAVRRLAVFFRDEWVCGICSDIIDPGLPHPHPFSVSLDHIVPVSRGGVHSMDNCQAAHLRCNLRKYASLPKSAA